MEIIILASGSKGNAISIKTNKTHILIDVGLTYKTLQEKAIASNIDFKNITDVFITHEHQDHIKGLQVFAKNNEHINFYLTKKTYESFNDKIKENIKKYQFINNDDEIIINDLTLKTFSLSHDAADPVGYVISHLNKKVVLATDTGYIDEVYFNMLANANLYILEANHEPSMLMDSRRPYSLKQRILGERGHLSNHEAAWLINEFVRDSSNAIWAIAHISEDCNTNYLIEKAIVDILEDPTKIEVIYTSQETTEKIVL